MSQLQRPPSAQPTSSAAVILALGRALSPRPRASCAHSEALRPGDRGLAIAVSSRAVQGLPSRHSMISRSANLGEKRRVVIFIPAIQSLGEWAGIGSFASKRAAAGSFRSTPECGNTKWLQTLQQLATMGFHPAPQIPSLAFDHCPALRVP
jgi:hypothetical protein